MPGISPEEQSREQPLQRCPYCRGTGQMEYLGWERAIFEGEDEPPIVKKLMPCRECDGEGTPYIIPHKVGDM